MTNRTQDRAGVLSPSVADVTVALAAFTRTVPTLIEALWGAVETIDEHVSAVEREARLEARAAAAAVR